MTTIFISHSAKDSVEAVRLKNWVQSQGFEGVFLDFDSHAGIAPGADWERTIYREINRAAAVLLVLTPNWLNSKWCFAEFTQARALGKAIYPLIESPEGDLIVSPDIQHLDLVTDRDGGLARLARQLTDVILNLQGGFSWEPSRAPFPGLMAMDEADAAVYFGRDDDIRRVIQRLNARRTQGGEKIITLLGASGSGKSSLMRAGVLPRLARDKSNWIVVPPFRPRVHPIEELAQALARVSDISWDAWRDALNGPEAADRLRDLARNLRAARRANEACVLVSIDQGEELFGVADKSQANRLLELIAAMSAEDMPFLVFIGLRSDYLGHWQSAEALGASGFEQVSLKPMPVERVRQIIEGPARVAGFTVEDALIHAATKDAGVDDALPLLAFALRELADRHDADKRLTLAAYQALGDAREGLSPLENALKRRADETLDLGKLAPEDVDALKDALVPAIVDVNEDGEYVRQPADLDAMPARARGLVERLVQARLLTASHEGQGRRVEVVHEALLRKWPTLRGWLDERREFIVGRKQLKRDVADWRVADASGKTAALLTGLKLTRARGWLAAYPRYLTDEERGFIEASLDEAEAEAQRREAERIERERLRSRLLRGAVVAAIVAAVLAGLAGWQWRRAGESATAERAQRTIADEKSALAQASAAEATKQSVLAEQRRQDAEAKSKEAAEQAALAEQRGQDAQRQKDAAEKSAAEAIAQKDAAEANQAAALSSLAETKLSTRPADAIKLALASWPRDADSKLSRSKFTFSLLQRAIDQNFERHVLVGHASGILSVEFSPDQSSILTVSGDGTARIWDSRTGAAQAVFDPKSGPLQRAHFSPDGSKIVTAGGDGVARVWDVQGAKEIGELKGHQKGLTEARFSPDGARIVTASVDHTARLWDSASGQVIAVLDAHKDTVQAANFTPDGQKIVTVSGDLLHSVDPSIGVWDGVSGTLIQLIRGHQSEIHGFAFSPDGKTFVTYSGGAHEPGDPIDDTARIWDLQTGRQLVEMIGHKKFIEDAKFSPNGKTVVTASGDGTAAIWDASTGERLKVLGGGEDGVSVGRVTFSAGGSRIVTAAIGGKVKVWDTPTGKLVAELKGHTGTVEGVLYSRNADRIITVSADKTARIWDSTSFSPARIFFDQGPINMSVYSADGAKILTASGDGIATLRDAASGNILAAFGHEDYQIETAAISPSGERIVLNDLANNVSIWNAETGAKEKTVETDTAFHTFALSPDGEELAVAAVIDGKVAVEILRTSDGSSIREFSQLPDLASDIAFSPDGRIVAVALIDGTAQLWNVATGEGYATFEGHRSSINHIRFSPDGRRAVTASNDRNAIIWDVATGKRLLTLRGSAGSVANAEFSPDGRNVLTESSDGVARIFDAASGKILVAMGGAAEQTSLAHYSPSGQLVMTALPHGEAAIWDAATGTRLERLIGHADDVWATTLSPDGTHALTSSRDGSARIWDLTGISKGNVFGVVCAALSDRKLDDLVATIGLGQVEPICTGKEPLPDAPTLLALGGEQTHLMSGGGYTDGALADAWNALFDGDYQQSLDIAGTVMRFGYEQDKIKANLIRAHALLFLGRVEEAKSVYLAGQGQLVRDPLRLDDNDADANEALEQIAVDDFKEFRSVGLKVPDIDDIEKLYASNLDDYQRIVDVMRDDDVNKLGNDDFAGGLQSHQKEIDQILRPRVETHPDNHNYARMLYNSLIDVSVFKQKLGDDKSGEGNLRLAVGMIEKLQSKYDTDPIWQYDLLKTLNRLIPFASDKMEIYVRMDAIMRKLLMTDFTFQGLLMTQWYPDVLQGMTKLNDDAINKLVAEGKFEEALDVQKRVVSQFEYAEGYGYVETASLQGVLNSEAWDALAARKFDLALDAAQRAVDLSEAPESRRGPMTSQAAAEQAAAPGAKWLPMTNKAHALMFLDRLAEAREIYLSGRGQMVDGKKTWESAISNDFAELKKIGLTSPLMAEIEADFAKTR